MSLIRATLILTGLAKARAAISFLELVLQGILLSGAVEAVEVALRLAVVVVAAVLISDLVAVDLSIPT